MSTGINIGKSIKVLDEGSTLTSDVAQINFTGSGVAATAVGNNVTVNVTGSSGVWGISNASGVYTYYATLTLAMAAAVAALGATGPVYIRDSHCVAKSYPGFFDDLRKIGAIVHE